MTTAQPTSTQPAFTLPRVLWLPAVLRFLRNVKTQRALAQLSAQQLKDIGVYRDTKVLSSTLTRQLW